MITSIAFLVGGFVLLVIGGEVLLRGAVALARLLNMTPAIIGLTVVAAGTSVPELAVSIGAAIQGNTDICVGNVVGSNIANSTLILAVAALILPLTIRGNTIKLEYPAMLLVTLMCVAVGEDGMISRLDGILFLATYVGFTAYMVSLVRGQMTQTEVHDHKKQVDSLSEELDTRPRWVPSLLFLFVGAALLGGGAHFAVLGAVDLARLLNISDRIIGLSVVAIGTSLPEIVTSAVASYRGRDDVAIGNIIGSNIFNILVILGFSAMVQPLPFAPEIAAWDAWWMLGIAAALFPIIATGIRISRLEGALLLATYATYLFLLVREVAF